MAIEKTFFARGRHASLLRLVSDQIDSQARALGLDVVEIAPSSIKKSVTGDGHANKRELARAVCSSYPQLRAYLGAKRKWQARFHANMFDAVAVAMVGYGRLGQVQSDPGSTP